MKLNISQIRAIVQDESKQKILLVPLLLLLFIVCWATANQLGVFDTVKPPAASSNNQKAPVPKAQPAQPKTAAPAPAGVSSDAAAAKLDIAQSYPFIADKNAAVQTAAAAGPGSVPQGNANGSLPAIPGYQPRPNVGSVPIPSAPPIPGSIDGNSYRAPSAPQSTTVQGVFTGNDGKNIAIMSDGKIVQEGDSYGDNRITAIMGDGIRFENGNNISYGIK